MARSPSLSLLHSFQGLQVYMPTFLLKELNQAGQTIVMVTHEDDIAENANRTIHFLDGEILP
mgnify:CR=1 FL=1